MRIGELADRTGASVRSLRYYEEQDLILSTRTQGGQRMFPDDAIDRVRLIQVLLAAGLPSRRIAEIMPCVYSGTVTPAMFGQLISERDRIEEQLRGLTETLGRLDGVIEAARDRLIEEGSPVPRDETSRGPDQRTGCGVPSVALTL